MNLEKAARKHLTDNGIEITDEEVWKMMGAIMRTALNNVVDAARKIEDPCDSCEGVCSSERETAQCSASLAYDKLKKQIKKLDSIH